MHLQQTQTPISQVPVVPPKLPPHVVRRVNSTGRDYYYFVRHHGTRKRQQSIRLPDDPRDPAWWAAYAAAAGTIPTAPRTDTVSALIAAWQDSPEWRQMQSSTQRLWRGSCAHIERAWGPLEVRGIEPRHVLALRDLHAATPAAANNLLRCLTRMLAWGVPRGWRDDNPCREVEKLKGGDGYAPWDWDVIEAARAELRPDLWWAVALALYTGQRQSDVLSMRWSAINAAGLIAVRQSKTGKDLLIPIHRDLQAVLDTIPRCAVTILTTSDGRPWQSGFKASWRKLRPAVVRERGLVFHGLRKSAVCFLLEAGCTDAEVAAITGQTRQMIEHYAALVNQQRLARGAMLKWETLR